MAIDLWQCARRKASKDAFCPTNGCFSITTMIRDSRFKSSCHCSQCAVRQPETQVSWNCHQYMRKTSLSLCMASDCWDSTLYVQLMSTYISQTSAHSIRMIIDTWYRTTIDWWGLWMVFVISLTWFWLTNTLKVEKYWGLQYNRAC